MPDSREIYISHLIFVFHNIPRSIFLHVRRVPTFSLLNQLTRFRLERTREIHNSRSYRVPFRATDVCRGKKRERVRGAANYLRGTVNRVNR